MRSLSLHHTANGLSHPLVQGLPPHPRDHRSASQWAYIDALVSHDNRIFAAIRRRGVYVFNERTETWSFVGPKRRQSRLARIPSIGSVRRHGRGHLPRLNPERTSPRQSPDHMGSNQTTMKIYMLLLITLLACSESDPVSPTGRILRGSFVLTKAVGHQLMDLGGDHIDDPVIIRRVPHTYYYPEGAGSLILREDTFYMEAPMPLQPIRIKGTLESVSESNTTYWRVEIRAALEDS